MQVTGKTMIFKNDKGYSTTIGNKNQDGEWDKMYITVNFKGGTEIENKTKINIKDGFLSFYKNKEGLPIAKIIVMEFEKLKKGQASQTNNTVQTNTNDFGFDSTDDSLPF